MLIWSARGWLKEICFFIKSTLLLLLITSFMTRYCFISEQIHSILGAHGDLLQSVHKMWSPGLTADRIPMEKGLLNWLRSPTFDEVYLLLESHYNTWQAQYSLEMTNSPLWNNIHMHLVVWQREALWRTQDLTVSLKMWKIGGNREKARNNSR